MLSDLSHKEANSKIAARYIFEHLSIMEYRITGREQITADIVTCIKVGKDWKILKSETLAIRKIDKKP
jgi:hypothetical protein